MAQGTERINLNNGQRREQARGGVKSRRKSGNPGGRSIRARLVVAFLLFALVLMGTLWILQTVFLETYYEKVTQRKVSGIVRDLSSLYSQSAEFDYDQFCDRLGDISSENDIYFYLEAVDGSFHISSVELMASGRFMTGGSDIINGAKERLINSGVSSVSFSIGGKDDKILVYASTVGSSYREPVYFYAVSRLRPLESAVGILASQLMFVTIAALVIGLIIALWYSKRLAAPIAEISERAKLLGKGCYDVNFEGGSCREINQLAGSLAEAAEDLKKADALQKDLMANVSHDLRTPLTMIKSYAELIRDISGEDPERRNEHLEVIVDETDRLSELVGDILTLSRIQSGALQMEMDRVDIQDAAEHVLATYKVLEENEAFIFNFNRLPEKITVIGDERRLQQVFSNLLSNAVHYSADVKEITVNFVLTEDGMVRCEVADRGVGIELEELDKIWNRYQRASNTGTRCSGGTGLGLSIAREILVCHGAYYGVSSTPGVGSCFWFAIQCEIEQNS